MLSEAAALFFSSTSTAFTAVVPISAVKMYSLPLSIFCSYIKAVFRSFLLLRNPSPGWHPTSSMWDKPRRGGISHLRCEICVACAQYDSDLHILPGGDLLGYYCKYYDNAGQDVLKVGRNLHNGKAVCQDPKDSSAHKGSPDIRDTLLYNGPA